jgi:Stress responsive A/B Barrel Domain
MNRNVALLAVLFLAALATWAAVSSSARTAGNDEGKAAADKTPPFVHCVIFYLNKDAPEGEADAMIADINELLRPIPSVRGLRAGKPAVKEKRDNAKTDFQVGLLVLFDNAEGLDTYIKHPQHVQFVEKHGKYIERQKLGVYDFVEQKQ